MNKLIVILTIFIASRTVAEEPIRHLDDEDYYRMPSKYCADYFQRCVGRRHGVYCTVWADLVSDQPSDLLSMIQAYSAYYTNHYNHSNIMYGLCLTSRCKQFFDDDGSQQAMWTGAEACLNDSLTREHGLQARVTDADCYRHGHRFETNAVDVAIFAVLAIILALNVAGSVYDLWIRDHTQTGIEYLMYFSVPANFKSLVEPLPATDRHQQLLRVMNGIRVLSSVVVVMGHVVFPTANAAVNTKAFEETYNSFPYMFMHHAHLVVQTFFLMSGFLLAYNMEKDADREEITWRKLPKSIYDRWLRLSPVNLVVVMLTATWYKYIQIGPLFKKMILQEATDCRKYWLYNAFFATNTIDHSECNLQDWYIASDMQMYILGLAALVLTPRRTRRWALAALYLLGVGYSVYLVYVLDLDGTFVNSPSTVTNFFLSDPGFNTIYKRSVPNLPCFVMGMCCGLLVYDLQKRNLLNVSYRKYRVAYWLTVVAMFLLLPSVYIFYQGVRPPLLVRLLFVPVIRPLVGLCVNLIILGAIYKCDDLVRGILEWSGWVPFARLSYCLFHVHMMVERYSAGARDTLYSGFSHHLVESYFGMQVESLIAALALHLLVEAPFQQLFKAKPAKRKSEGTEPPKEEKMD